jgi:putative peptide zinc metalloprotease protein
VEGVWARLEERLEYGAFVPAPVEGIERADLSKRDGTPYTVLKAPHAAGGAGTYVQLELTDLELFGLMDGKRSVAEILVEHLQRSGYLALDRLARLTASLAANGFFGEARVDAYERLRLRRARRDPLIQASLALRRLVLWNIASWSNPERLVDLLYRAGGRLFFTRLGAALVLLISVLGIATWVREFGTPGRDMYRIGGSLAWGIVGLALAQVASISIHEAGHALAIRHFGRRVRALGLAFYYLFPCAYVDATDMVMAPRRQRIIAALAGPIAGVTVASLAMLVATTSTDPIVRTIAFQAATLLVFQFVFNLLPILDLDGYHVLVDALDAPLLRQRALAFVRAGVPRKLRRRERWTGQEVLLGSYGALALAASIGMLLFGAWIWRTRLGPLAEELAATGPVGLLILTVLVLVFVGPVVIALGMHVVGMVRRALGAIAERARHAERAVLIDRMRTLARVRFLSNLTPQALIALADHINEERVEPGQIVVTYGEPASAFYIVREGRLEAIGPDGGVYHEIIPGEGFGELALLDGTPRTATVRAVAPSVVWSIDKGQFLRWIRDRFEVAARIRASDEERTRLRRLPFFGRLGEAELDRLAAKLVTRRIRAGDFVFEVGDQGDHYYLIREGTAEVISPEGRTVRTLGPDQDFGDLALLFGRPRSMSVRAVTDLVLLSLARRDFGALLAASGETVETFRERTTHYENVPGLGSAVRG